MFSLETHRNFCLLSDIFPHTRHILHCTKILQYSLDIEHMNLPDDLHIPPFYLKNQGLRFKNLIEQLQPNKYETDLYFLQIFQSNTSVCLIISVFCKSCEPICEPEIVLQMLLQLTFRLPPLTSAANTLSRSVFSSQILQYAEINIVVFWKF